MIQLYLILLLLILAVIFFKYLRWEYSSYVQTIDLIPGPKKKPFIGNILDVPVDLGETLKTVQGKWVKEYGNIFRVWFGSQVFIDISSPPLIEKIMTCQKFINKGETYNPLLPFIGDGLLLSSGNKWRRNRRLLTPAFHFQILDNFFDVFNKNAEILCQQLIHTIGHEYDNEKEIDVFPLLKRCTLDVICETAMGININAQTEDTEYIRAVQTVSVMIIERFFSFSRTLPDWLYNLSTKGRKFTRNLKVVHDFTRKVINERKKEIEKDDLQEQEESNGGDALMGLKKRRAFLDLMLIASRKGAELSDNDIHNEVDTFMFEGHDTTSSAAVWFLYCIATNPVHQDLIKEELDQVFGISERPCTMEDLANMKYLECCIKESMRLYPAVPNIKRHISEDTELGGYKIPAGATVSLHIFALHRNEKYFPDPEVFKPERFQSDQSPGGHHFAFVPFSAGPRNCIGQRFALLEEKVILSSLLRQFRFSYDFGKHGPAIPAADLVLKPLYGMPLIVSRQSLKTRV